MVFNVGGGNNISVRELISLIEAVLKKDAEILFDTTQKGDVDNTLADTRLIKEHLGWCPSITIEEGLSRMADWFIIK